MIKRFAFSIIFVLFCAINLFSLPVEKKIIIVCPSDASKIEQFAAKEIRRYIFLRTGQLLTITSDNKIIPGKTEYIVVAKKNHRVYFPIVNPDFKFAMDSLQAQEYWVRTIQLNKSLITIVCGGSEVSTLYAAYRFIESLGVKYYLHGDVIPDSQIPLQLPAIDERAKPLFDLRGIQPFHDFPEGPDWWNLDDYYAVLSQLPKLRMNFFGLHTYPEERPNAEPTVWIGTKNDIAEDGKVKFSYPSSYHNTLRGNWGYIPKKTSDYLFGSASLFERDEFGSDIMLNMFPQPQKPEDFNEVFNRTGIFLQKTFTYAKYFGIKTCVGTETPLIVPKNVKERLKSAGKNSNQPEIIKELYEGIFNRIKNTYPIDYYWLWTPEGWTWEGTTDSQTNVTLKDLQIAEEAAKNQNVPFTLATCGWVLGPQKDRTMFDKILPKEMPFSCINQQVGFAPVDSSFAKIQGRPKWSIPWLEDDPALTQPQLWVGRVRRDAADALKYGCTGLMGIHWRTKILSPNILAIAYAGWDQSGWNKPQSINTIQKIKKAGPIGGKISTFYNNPIEATTEDSIYQSVRYGMSGYSLSIPSGTYNVILKFCEPFYKSTGSRVFDVSLQGKEVISNLDIFAMAGQNRAYDYTFNNVEVPTGWLDIEFKKKVESPTISAIIVFNGMYSKKINCGGLVYKDYVADWKNVEEETNYLPTDDLYKTWVTNQFGSNVSFPITEIFKKIDGKLPRPADWTDGPGGLKPDSISWEVVKKSYSFIDELSVFKQRIEGIGNSERFDYWLNNFLYMKSMSQLRCRWFEFNKTMKKISDEKDLNMKKQLSNQYALPIRIEMVRITAEIYKYLLLTISNTGELGTLMNWEQHLLPTLLMQPAEELTKILGGSLPDDAIPSKLYSGITRIIVPTIRYNYFQDEDFNLKILILSENKQNSIEFNYRELGKGSFTKLPVININRNVYTVKLTKNILNNNDFEYYIRVIGGAGKEVYFPSTAPKMNQTVVNFEIPK